VPRPKAIDGSSQETASRQFQPGNPGGGRPLGSRNRLTEVALGMLGANFAEHGEETIEKVRREKPHIYLQVVASLLPRQVQMEKLSPLGDLSDEELAELEVHLTATRARLVKKIERHNGAAIELESSDKNEQEK
jgi:hypothetical protein